MWHKFCFGPKFVKKEQFHWNSLTGICITFAQYCSCTSCCENWNKLQLDGLLYLSTDLTYLTIVYKRDENTSAESKSTYLLSGGFCLSDQSKKLTSPLDTQLDCLINSHTSKPVKKLFLITQHQFNSITWDKNLTMKNEVLGCHFIHTLTELCFIERNG